MGTEYMMKKALFDETLNALEALGMRMKKYSISETMNWCRIILMENPKGITAGQKLAAAFFLDNAVKIARGFTAGAVAKITGHPDAIAHLVKEQQDFDRISALGGFKPKVTYRLDEQIRWNLIQARILEGGTICHLSTDD